jgi:hypothetical protein
VPNKKPVRKKYPIRSLFVEKCPIRSILALSVNKKPVCIRCPLSNKKHLCRKVSSKKPVCIKYPIRSLFAIKYPIGSLFVEKCPL